MLSIFFFYFLFPFFVFVFSKDFAIYPGALISAEIFVFHANLLFVSTFRIESRGLTSSLRHYPLLLEYRNYSAAMITWCDVKVETGNPCGMLEQFVSQPSLGI